MIFRHWCGQIASQRAYTVVTVDDRIHPDPTAGLRLRRDIDRVTGPALFNARPIVVYSNCKEKPPLQLPSGDETAQTRS